MLCCEIGDVWELCCGGVELEGQGWGDCGSGVSAVDSFLSTWHHTSTHLTPCCHLRVETAQIMLLLVVPATAWNGRCLAHEESYYWIY
jgi:hypothetical protein